MKTAFAWWDDECPDPETSTGADIIALYERIQADALRHAAEMNCANHVPACICDVCAFTKRILTAAQTLEAPAAQPNDGLEPSGAKPQQPTD